MRGSRRFGKCLKTTFERTKSLEPSSLFIVVSNQFPVGLLAFSFYLALGGVKIIDLSGSVSRCADYTSDSLQIVFSSGKTVSALVIAYLVKQGRLDYEQPIAKYWPEFAQQGKEAITLRELLMHDAGLAFFERDRELTRDMLEPEKREELSGFLASAKPVWTFMKNLRPGERIYHAGTRGFYLNELCRRVDVKQRTIGKILLEEIMPQVNHLLPESESAVLSFGSPTEEVRKSLVHYEVAPIVKTIVKEMYKEVKKKFVKKEEDNFVKHLDPQFVSDVTRLRKETKKAVGRKLIRRVLKAGKLSTIYSIDDHYAYEGPSFNLVANAKSLCAFGHAFLFAPPEHRLLDDSTIQKMFSTPTPKIDVAVMDQTTFVTGGFSLFKETAYPDFLHKFYGWHGIGGSVFAFCPEHELVVSYTPCRFPISSFGGFLDKRCLRMMKALMEVIEPPTLTIKKHQMYSSPAATSTSQISIDSESTVACQ